MSPKPEAPPPPPPRCFRSGIFGEAPVPNKYKNNEPGIRGWLARRREDRVFRASLPDRGLLPAQKPPPTPMVILPAGMEFHSGSARIKELESALAITNAKLTTSKRLIDRIGWYSDQVISDAMDYQASHERRPIPDHPALRENPLSTRSQRKKMLYELSRVWQIPIKVLSAEESIE